MYDSNLKTKGEFINNGLLNHSPKNNLVAEDMLTTNTLIYTKLRNPALCNTKTHNLFNLSYFLLNVPDLKKY